MRTQSVVSALASAALLGAVALLAGTAPSRAILTVPLLSSPANGEPSHTDGDCGIAGLSRPNLENRSGYARPTLVTPASQGCASAAPAPIWKS
jgi:hypothetical protein